MDKNITKLLALIPKSPASISPGELVLKLKLRTNKELKDFNKDIKWLLAEKTITRQNNGNLALSKPSRSSKSYSEYQSTKTNHYKKPTTVSQMNISENPADDFETVSKMFKLSREFPLKVMDSTNNLESILQKSIKNITRKNYTQDLVITIDGEHAKDLDDAISVKKINDHYQLYVHIADVSCFIKEDSEIDKEAQKRGNSVYLVRHVIPMLPEILSNHYCSLNPAEKKLTLSCEININTQGEVISFQFYEGVIQSQYRLTYNFVEDILTKKQSHTDTHLLSLISLTEELASLLKKKRLNEGSLDFNLPEAEIVCDEMDVPIKFEKKEKLSAHTIIEDFMLVANQCAAKLLWKNKTGIFRVHEPPTQDKLQEFYQTSNSIGLQVKPFRNSQEIQTFLNKERPPYLNALVNQLLVRSMSQAMYANKNTGHFGLGFSLYTHFTSPIRRYSDLIVHRQIKGILKMDNIKQAFQPKYLSRISAHISKTERLAIDAERKMEKIKAIRFLEKYPKDLDLPAYVVGILPRGIFVALEHTHIEGFIPIEELKGYEFAEKIKSYINKDTHKSIIMGSHLLVNIYNLNLQKGFIDFKLSPVYKPKELIDL